MKSPSEHYGNGCELKQAGVKTLYIAPGSLWEIAYSETFNSRFRDELLNREIVLN